MNLMAIRFAESYITRLLADRDIAGLYHLIRVMGREHPLGEAFWLFCRLLEWRGSSRSGVWQYCDGLPDELFVRMSEALEKFGLLEIAVNYRIGRRSWDGPDRAASVDDWIETHEDDIGTVAFELIASRRRELIRRK
jgi:hypothetical protein